MNKSHGTYLASSTRLGGRAHGRGGPARAPILENAAPRKSNLSIVGFGSRVFKARGLVLTARSLVLTACCLELKVGRLELEPRSLELKGGGLGILEVPLPE